MKISICTINYGLSHGKYYLVFMALWALKVFTNAIIFILSYAGVPFPIPNLITNFRN